MFSIDYQSRVPIYEQIINEIERFVALGVLKPKEQIASIRDLAKDLGINPNTVRKAYCELENREVITTISTKGTFISEKTNLVIEKKIASSIEKISEIIDELERLGIDKKEILTKLK